MKTYYPAFLNLEKRRCLVVGGGAVALRKAKALLKAKAKVFVVSPAFTTAFKALSKKRSVSLVKREFKASDLKGAQLVICATDDAKLNSAVSKIAQRENILVNVVDVPVHSNFIVPASFSRGPLTIAISTSGASPLVAKRIRLDLEKRFGKDYGSFLKKMQKARGSIIKKFPDAKARKKAFAKMINQFMKGRS